MKKQTKENLESNGPKDFYVGKIASRTTTKGKILVVAFEPPIKFMFRQEGTTRPVRINYLPCSLVASLQKGYTSDAKEGTNVTVSLNTIMTASRKKYDERKRYSAILSGADDRNGNDFDLADLESIADTEKED